MKCNVLEEIVNSFVNCDVLKIIPICVDLSYLRQWCNKENFKPPCHPNLSVIRHNLKQAADSCLCYLRGFAILEARCVLFFSAVFLRFANKESKHPEGNKQINKPANRYQLV